MTKAAAQAAKTVAVPTRDALIELYARWATEIPSGSSDTATISILSQISATSEPTTLDTPWETRGTDELLGRTICVTELKRMPSDYSTGLGYYLVVSAYDPTTAEICTFTSGATSVVAQLTKAHHEGWLPLTCQIIRAERPTPNGYYPEHLRIVGFGETPH